MDEISINEWIGIIYHFIKKQNLSEKDLSENLEQKIEEAMEKELTPINLKKRVMDGVVSKFKKNRYNIWRVYDQTNNPNIKYCNIRDIAQHNHIDTYTNTLRNDRSSKYIDLLNHNSKEIIERFPNPIKSKNNYKFKGLVIGQIQSGKTANIEALVCRAVDFGYRFIIIMCGRKITLRQQTQLRFDNEVFTEPDSWSRLTNYNKDFNAGTMDIPSQLKSNIANIAIIKKIPPTLEKLKNKIKEKPELKNYPCLIIDDECDDASIDTNANKEELDPTKTNQEIRNLINYFDKVVYVGFSATPFANVFIDANNEDDLYPSDFIFLLDTPEGYTGTEDFIEDYRDNFISIPVDNTNEISAKKLKEATYSFVLSCCIIKEENISLPGNNFSMLIHPSHKTYIHSKYEKEVKIIVEGLKHYLEYDKYHNIKKDFESLYKKQFISVDIPFDKIFKHYKYFVSKIEIKKLNSERPAEDELNNQQLLEYHKKDKVYIVIGGNILSRGLTLEGLLVSFFIRESRGKHQYDSLLQMQRWCGFKKDYLRYTKIYTTQRLKRDLTYLVSIEKDFRENIKEMFNEEGNSPSLVKPQIRTNKLIRVVSKVKEGASFKDIHKMGLDLKTLEFFSKEEKLQKNIDCIKEWTRTIKWQNYNRKIISKTPTKKIQSLVDSYEFYNPEYKKRVQIQIEHYKKIYPSWTIELHSPEKEKYKDFFYSENLKVKKVRRGLKEKGHSLKIELLNHKLEKSIDQPKLIIYIIDEKSNEFEDNPKLDKNLTSHKPIVALYFQFPIEEPKNGTNRGQ